MHVLAGLLLDLDLHERVLVVVLVEVGGAEGHLRLAEDGLLVVGGARADLVVLDEKVPVLVLAMPVVHFLLQAFDGLLLVGPLGDGHEIAGVGHAVVARLPGAHALRGLRDLVEVVLSHAAPDIHRGHRMVLFIDKRGDPTAPEMLLRRLLLLRAIQIIGRHIIHILAFVQAARVAVVEARGVRLSILFGG